MSDPSTKITDDDFDFSEFLSDFGFGAVNGVRVLVEKETGRLVLAGTP